MIKSVFGVVVVVALSYAAGYFTVASSMNKSWTVDAKAVCQNTHDSQPKVVMLHMIEKYALVACTDESSWFVDKDGKVEELYR